MSKSFNMLRTCIGQTGNMRITRRQLRSLLREVLIAEGILDAAENWAVTALGHAGVGDVAAGIKAGTVDLGRVVKDASDLGSLLKPYGLPGITILGKRDDGTIQAVADVISTLPQSERDEIKDEIYNLGESIKRMLISLVSLSPDVAISGTTAAAITMLPIEKLFIDGAPIFNDLVNKAKSLPGGETIGSMLSFVRKATSGPVAWLFGDPMTAFGNLGLLVSAASGSGSDLGTLAQTAADVGQQALGPDFAGFDLDTMEL